MSPWWSLVRRSSSRPYSSQGPPHRHVQWYTDILPGMVPVALIGSTVYMALQLIRTNLSHEKYLDEARARVHELEAMLDELQKRQDQSESKKVIGTSHLNRRRWWFF